MFSPSSLVFSELFLHFNWHCNLSQPTIFAELQTNLYQWAENYCTTTKGVWFKGIGEVEDHLHLVVQVEPFICPSDFVGKIKGASSHAMNELFGAKSLQWQRGYGIVSFAARDLSSVLRYVALQREHHGKETANAILENWGHDEGPGPFAGDKPR